MKITKLDMLKLVNNKEAIEKVKRFLCEASVEAEQDGGDLFEVFWHGCSAFKEMKDEDVLTMFWEFHLDGETYIEGIRIIKRIVI